MPRLSLRGVLLAVAALWSFAFVTVPATFAQPVLGWNPSNHTWIGISSSSTNALINPVTSRQLPDTVTITCPLAAANPTSTQCSPLPNDGHTYKVIAVNYAQTNAGATAGCSVTVGVAGATTPVANAVGQITPIPCANATTTANTTFPGTVISTPAAMTSGNMLDVVLASPTAIAGGSVSVTLQVVS